MASSIDQVRWLPINELTPDAFALFGQMMAPISVGGQAAPAGNHKVTSKSEANLVLENGVPRLWVMELPKVGLSFFRMARHRRVTQCLGSLEGKDWFIAVAPPSDLANDNSRPKLDDITAFRIRPGYSIKLHVGTWHAGPHYPDDKALFFNLEHMNTNAIDNNVAELGCVFRFRM
jgi:ureidoglycolate hydrolase